MTTSLKELICKIDVTNSCFSDGRSREIADEVFRRHTLQSVLESLSDLRINNKNKPQSAALSDSIGYLSKVKLLIDCSTNIWISEFANGFSNSDTLSLCIGSLRTVAKTATEQFEKDREVYTLQQNDFDNVRLRAEVCLKIFDSLFDKLRLSQESGGLLKCCRHLLVYSIQTVSQHLENQLWTSDESVKIAKNLLQEFLSYFGCSEIKHILIMDVSGHISDSISSRNSIFGRLLVDWKPFLLRDTWRQNPMIVAAFTVCLRSVTFPHLSDFIEYVLPPSLLILDDYMTRNKVIGIECIVHIIKSSSAEELRWYGRADVIYEALKHQMYSTEESVLQLTYPALLEVLNIVVKPPSSFSDSTKYDEILQMMLQSAAHENKLVLRRTHTEYMHILFEKMGIGVIKHLQSILNLVEEYLDVSDAPSEQSRFNILKTLQSLILVAWPRVRCHVYRLTKALVKLIYSVSSDSFNEDEETKGQLLDDTVKCLDLLMALEPTDVSLLLSAAKEAVLSPQCITIIDKLLCKQSPI